MEAVLHGEDLLPLIFACMSRRDASVAACVCTTWHRAVHAIPAAAFKPRLVVGLSRQCKIVDITDLVFPSRLPHPLIVAPHPHSRSKLRTTTNRQPSWITSIAVSPYDKRCIHACQYRSSGIITFRVRNLSYKSVLIQSTHLQQPEGVAFGNGYMYAQSNWGHITRCSLAGRVLESLDLDIGWVTWALAMGPDNAIYITADQEYPTQVYTQLPQQTSGCVLRLPLKADGSFTQLIPQATQWSQKLMRRPCGLRWGRACETLFVTAMDPAVYRFAGPRHASPGSVLQHFDLQPAGLLPWDVVLLHDSTLVVTMHRHRTVRPPAKRNKSKSAIQAATAMPSLENNGSLGSGVSCDLKPSTSAMPQISAQVQDDLQDGDDLNQEDQNPHQKEEVDVEEVKFSGTSQEEEWAGYLCVIENHGAGPTRVIKLPEWMDHANMMCVDE